MNTDALLDAYERELSYLRRQGQEFAARYPKVAARLDLRSSGSTDPHVERLIEACAFLTARVQRRIDDAFPEITEAVLGALQPQLLAPIPSLAVAQLTLDARAGRATQGQLIPRHTALMSPPVGGMPCQFRTCYEATLWPVRISHAALRSPMQGEGPPPWARSVVEIRLVADAGFSLQELRLDRLRLYIHGESGLAHALYEHVMARVDQVHLGAGSAEPPALSRAAAEALRTVGFEEEDGLLPYAPATSLGHRLLLEYFAFPLKFLFFDVVGLGAAIGGDGEALSIRLYAPAEVPPFADAVDASTFRLGCAPIVNLFPRTMEPIRVSGAEVEHRVVPDRFRPTALEVYRVEAVERLGDGSRGASRVRPLYQAGGGWGSSGAGDAGSWTSARRPSLRPGGPEEDVYLTLLDQDPAGPPATEQVLRVLALCTNHDLPSSLPFGEDRCFGGGGGDFGVEGLPVKEIRCLTKPTASLRPGGGSERRWRLISHLSLSQLPLTADGAGLEALRETLRLFDWQRTAGTRQQIDGVVALRGELAAARIRDPSGAQGYARGVEVEVELDPSAFVGGGAYLLAAVLERLLGDSAPVNAFTQLRAFILGEPAPLRVWPPRVGGRPLL